MIEAAEAPAGRQAGASAETPEAKRLQERRFLSKPHPYVAQTRDGAFVSLVSRVALLDEVADTFR